MEYLIHMLIVASLYVILATSLNIVLGLGGMFAFCHAAFYALGAYFTGLIVLRVDYPFPTALLVAAIATAVLSVTAAVPALRVGGHYLVITTMALQVIVIDVFRNGGEFTGGSEGLHGIPAISLFGAELDTPGRFLPIAIVAAATCAFIAWRIQSSPFGRAVRAVRENELGAQSIGKDAVALKMIVFAFSAGLAAVAGSLVAQYIGFVGPQSFTFDETVYIVAMVILGGTGNVAGAALGAIVLVGLPELLKFVALPPAVADMMRNVVYGAILIVILRVRPQGLLPETHSVPRLRLEQSDQAEDFTIRAGGHGAPSDLKAVALHRDFGGIKAVDGVSLELPAGRVTGLIGPNGAGKTTAFNLLTGFLKPSAGRILYGGTDITDLRPHLLVKAGIARSFQDLRLFRHMTVLENVLVALPAQKGERIFDLFFRPRRVARQDRRNAWKAAKILEHVGLDHKRDASASGLSYAEEKLLVMARLLATGARTILLDEPLSGLDPATLSRLLPIIRDLAVAGCCVCIIEHNLDVIRDVCDEAVYLDGGQVLAIGRPRELLQDPVLVQRYLR